MVLLTLHLRLLRMFINHCRIIDESKFSSDSDSSSDTTSTADSESSSTSSASSSSSSDNAALPVTALPYAGFAGVAGIIVVALF